MRLVVLFLIVERHYKLIQYQSDECGNQHSISFWSKFNLKAIVTCLRKQRSRREKKKTNAKH